MRDFIDLLGASGAAYRFRILPSGTDPLRIAGNYAVVRPQADGLEVVLVGQADDLSRVRQEVSAASCEGAFLYIRLNVARAGRAAEHADLAGRYGGSQAGFPGA